VVNGGCTGWNQIIAGPKVFQKALFVAGVPHTAFQSDNLEQEYEKLVSLV